MKRLLSTLGLSLVTLVPSLALAAPAVADKADNAFMMICTALVLFYDLTGRGAVLRRPAALEERPLNVDSGDRHLCPGVACCGSFTATAWRSAKVTPSSVASRR
ncbi:Ammonia transporter [Serratia fonticola]|uniref:Ammonia transporter n=1 Tax=Serratia fonticola TaxID=47917 RepID=A0A4U9U4G5_SERFO|nr:Ammonia transporter [Serratia fonticola]